MASEVTKMDVIGNMGMDTRVIEVIDFKSEVQFDLRGLEAVLMPVCPHRPPEWLL